MSQPRKLKIQSKFRQRKWDWVTVSEIRLEGRSLTTLGFEEGQHVQLEQGGGMSIITICDK